MNYKQILIWVEFQDLTDNLIRGTDELKQRIDDDKKEIVDKLEGETTVIKARIETVKEESKNEAKRLEGERTKGKESLSERLRKENEEIQARMKRDAEERAKKEIDMKAGNYVFGMAAMPFLCRGVLFSPK